MTKILIFLVPFVLSLCSCASESVYICTGPQANVYHENKNCRGLNRCSGDVEKITIKQAKDLYRRPCKICAKE